QERLWIPDTRWIAHQQPTDGHWWQSRMIANGGACNDLERVPLTAVPLRHNDLRPTRGAIGEDLAELRELATLLGLPPALARTAAGAGANKLASSRNLVTKQTCWRTEAINSSAAKLESATMTMARSVNQRLVCRTACRAQSVSFLWRRPRSSLQRCEGAKIVRKGNAQRRLIKGICTVTIKESQRRPLALTKCPCVERTGSR